MASLEGWSFTIKLYPRYDAIMHQSLHLASIIFILSQKIIFLLTNAAGRARIRSVPTRASFNGRTRASQA